MGGGGVDDDTMKVGGGTSECTREVSERGGRGK